MHNTVNSRKSALLPSAHCKFSPYIITQIRENLYNYFNFFSPRGKMCGKRLQCPANIEELNMNAQIPKE